MTRYKRMQEMERLRLELYAIVDGKRETLNSEKTCKVSKRLDKLIVEHMTSRNGRRNNYR